MTAPHEEARGGALTVELGTPGRKRAAAIWLAVIAVVAGFLLVNGDTTGQVIAVGVVGFGLNAVLREFERLTVSADGLTFDRRLWRLHLPWDDLVRVRIDWTTAASSKPQLPVIERRDGRDVRRTAALHPLATADREPERRALEDRLRAEVRGRGVTLQIVADEA